MSEPYNNKITKMYLEETPDGRGYISSNYIHNTFVPPIIRTFTLSCEVFGRFTHTLDIYKLKSAQEIINCVLTKLREILVSNHLDVLASTLNNLWYKYHVHDYDIYNMLLEEREYYICNHNH